MDGLGVVDHERLGAELLRECGLGGKVADLVELHVQAKRYLCQARPAYAAKLSPASKGTLAFQGGPMTPDEARDFEAHPLFAEILRLRAWDEAAKVPDGQGLSVEELADMARNHKRGQSDA
jgi:predicted HD phosphohydrolase